MEGDDDDNDSWGTWRGQARPQPVEQTTQASAPDGQRVPEQPADATLASTTLAAAAVECAQAEKKLRAVLGTASDPKLQADDEFDGK